MDGQSKKAVILFADLVGSARLSDVLYPEDYDIIVTEFQEIAGNVLKEIDLPDVVLHCDGGVRGDEVVLIMTLKDAEDLRKEGTEAKGDPWGLELEIAAQAAREALNFAITFNVQWFLSERNIKRIDNNAAPIGVGIGLHYGPVFLGEHLRGSWNSELIETTGMREWKWGFKMEAVPEGFSINFAKRVEGSSRKGNHSGIAMSQSFYGVCRSAGLPVFIGKPLIAETKGFEQREPIFELIGQSVLTEYADLTGDDDPNGKTIDKVPLIRKAFARDPEKTIMLLELAIDVLFRKGNHNKVIELAEDTSRFIANPFSLLYRAARSYHRSAKEQVDPKDQERFVERALLLFRQTAAGEPDLVWADLDQAAGYWKKGISAVGDECGKQLDIAKTILENFLARQPRHFYAYNLLALVKAQRARSDPGLPFKERTRLFEEAQGDLEAAKELNPLPQYIYEGTEVIYYWPKAWVEKQRNVS